jgi:hypothetical protein
MIGQSELFQQNEPSEEIKTSEDSIVSEGVSESNLSVMDEIFQGINVRFSTHNYRLYNSYVFNWESDYFSVANQSYYIYEVEIKLSRADFKKDFTKVGKHNLLVRNNENADKIPNRFYYCCPEGMIKKEELPAYAGLLYFDKNYKIRQVRPAPLLHKNNNFDKYLRTLVDKFYFQFIKMKSDYRYIKQYSKDYNIIRSKKDELTKLLYVKDNIGFIEQITYLENQLEQEKERKVKHLMDNLKNASEVQRLTRELEKFKDDKNKDWRYQLSKVNLCQQRQDSLSDQLKDLITVANRFGFYDAATFLKEKL